MVGMFQYQWGNLEKDGYYTNPMLIDNITITMQAQNNGIFDIDTMAVVSI